MRGPVDSRRPHPEPSGAEGEADRRAATKAAHQRCGSQPGYWFGDDIHFSLSDTRGLFESIYSLTRKRLPAGSVLIRLGASHTVNALRRRVPNAKPFSDVIDELILEEFAKLPPELRDSDAGSSLLGIDRLAKLRNRLENPKLRKLLLAYKRSVKAGKDPRFVWSRLVLTAVVAGHWRSRRARSSG